MRRWAAVAVGLARHYSRRDGGPDGKELGEALACLDRPALGGTLVAGHLRRIEADEVAEVLL